MTAPTLDECLSAFAVARKDLQDLETRGGRVFNELEDLQRMIREKRALVARLRAEVVSLMPDAKGGQA